MYIVVTNFNAKENKCMCLGVSDDGAFNVVKSFGLLCLDQLANFTIQYKLKPLNFSIDRKGNVIQNIGGFSRLEKCEFVALAEITKKTGKTLGYRLIRTSNSMTINHRIEDILQWGKDRDYPLIQNAIIRDNCVACYPQKPFKKIVLDAKNQTRKATVAPVKKQSSKKPANKSAFSVEQEKEFMLCNAKGVDIKIIYNTDLSPKQMRVIWVSKSKGIKAEYFNRPEYSEDAMKFYADTLYTKQVCDECALMLKHPELSAEQLRELYICVCEDIDYTDMIGLTPDQIRTERINRTLKLWNNEETQLTEEQLKEIDYSLFENAMRVYMKRKGIE